MRTALSLSWRYLSGRPFRAALTTLAVVLGVALTFGLNGILPAASQAFTSNLFAAAGKVDITVTNSSGGFFDPSVADQVSAVQGIKASSPVLRRALALPKGGPISTLTVVGVDPGSFVQVRQLPVQSGRFLLPGDQGVIAIGSATAQQLGAHVGSTIRLPSTGGTIDFTVVGILNVPAVPGAEEVFVSLADAERMFSSAGQVNEVDASLLPGANRTLVEAAVRRRLGTQYTTAGLESSSQLLASLKVSQFAFLMFGVFALVMAAFIILNTFRTIVSERRHDIGMLRAVGASRSSILLMFLMESSLQGAIGVGLGLLLGYGMAIGMIALLNPFYKSVVNIEVGPPIFSAGTWALAIVLGMATTILGALAPAYSASKVSPMEALRPQVSEVSERKRSIWPWVGLGLLVVSLFVLFLGQVGGAGYASVTFLIGLVLVAPVVIAPAAGALSLVLRRTVPAEAELARSNMQRQPGRAAVTVSAVMISLAIVVALIGVIASIFAGFTTYIDKSLSGADFVVLPAGLILGGGNVGADQAFVSGVQAIPGVGAVATLKLGQGQYNNANVQVVGINPTDYLKVASFEFTQGGSNADIMGLTNTRTVIANGIFAAQNGIVSGQLIDLNTPTGLHTYKVLTVGTDYLNAKIPTLYVSQDTLSNDFGVQNAVAVLINAGPGASVPAVKQRLASFVAGYPQFAFYDTRTFKQQQLALFNQTFVLFDLLIGILALPSLLALLNTLIIGVLARTREIGMLRAVGSTRRQVRGMVLTESLMLAALGVVFGAVGGIVLGYALVQALNTVVGYPSPYVFPWGGLLAAVVIGLISAAAASILPSRQAARLDIVDALHFE